MRGVNLQSSLLEVAGKFKGEKYRRVASTEKDAKLEHCKASTYIVAQGDDFTIA